MTKSLWLDTALMDIPSSAHERTATTALAKSED
jgi:hypothetical protein